MPHGNTCIIADDHPLMRDMLALRLEYAGCEVRGQAEDGATTIELLRRVEPDLAVIDYRMPKCDGIEVVRAVVANELRTKVILFTDESNPAVVRRAMAAGAQGYLNKAASRDVLEHAFQMVARGGSYIDPAVSARLLEPTAYALSPREIDVLTLMSDGLANKAIARALAVAEDTVKSHVSSVMAKLGTTSRTGAVSVALREELVA